MTFRCCASTPQHAHSSVDKAVIALGLGHQALRRIPADDKFSLRIDALEAALVEDRAAGVAPIAIVATVGTTSSTSVDDVEALASIAEREALWLHVDAAYRRDGDGPGIRVDARRIRSRALHCGEPAQMAVHRST